MMDGDQPVESRWLETDPTTPPPDGSGGNEAVRLPRTEAFLHRSTGSGREYLIQVAYPVEAPPPAGFPVIYLLDGATLFATVVDAIRLRSRRPDVTGVQPAVVVGIDYPLEEAGRRAARTHDYTPFPPDDADSGPVSGLAPGLSQPPAVGGADRFLAWIEAELKPRIGAGVPIDPGRQTLFGHSLGGLLVLHALASGRSTFRGYVASSPSIWWARRRVLQALAGVGGRARGDAVDLRVMVTVGEYEQVLAPHETGMPGAAEKRARRSRRRMVADSREAARLLATLPDSGGSVHFEVFAGEDHASTALLTINRMLRFALAP